MTGACAAKSLCGSGSSSSNNTNVSARFGVAEVVGGEAIGAQALKAYIEDACRLTPDVEVRVVQLDALPAAREGRAEAMARAGMLTPPFSNVFT